MAILIRGVGVDMACISEIARFLEPGDGSTAFERRTFSQAEQEAASKRHNRAEYYATRFASKEAVFKAIAPLLPEEGFDLRIVETLNREDGSPYIIVNEKLKPLLEKAQVNTLHISITTEGDFATAFVVASFEVSNL